MGLRWMRGKSPKIYFSILIRNSSENANSHKFHFYSLLFMEFSMNCRKSHTHHILANYEKYFSISC
jgi:hypothetical protein